MILTSLLAFAPIVSSPVTLPPAQSGTFVLKARRVEIGDGEVMEHAVMLIQDGKIVTMGQDLPVEGGLPVVELDDDQVVMPGIINPYTRYGMSGGGFNDSRPNVMASSELYPSLSYDAFLENGVTTIAQYPAGVGIPGQAVGIRPLFGTAESMTVADGVYLKIVMRNSSGNKRNLRQGFEKADQHLKKVETEREKFEKKNSKSKSKSKSKKDDKEEGEKKAGKKSTSKKKEVFVAPEPDPRVQPFFDLRDGKLRALFSINSAASYEHLIDAIGEEEFEWHLRIPLSREIDVFHVKDKIGELGIYTVMEPVLTLQPGTLRQRNLPAEFDRAGTKLILVPRADTVSSFESFLGDVGVMIGAGLDRAAAVRAVTMHPAGMLGLSDEYGTLEEGKHANLVVYSGDPFQPGTKIEAVLLDGEFVIGDLDQ